MEEHRAEFADWRDVPVICSGLSARVSDAIHAMNIATLGALFLAIKRGGSGLFKYMLNVGPVTTSELLAWYDEEAK